MKPWNRRKRNRHILRRAYDDDDEKMISSSKPLEFFRIFPFVLIWFAIATIVFFFSNGDWSVAASMFFAVQSGLSIGFNTYEDDDTNVSKMFTMIHLFISSILITVLVRSLKVLIFNIESSLANFAPSLRILIYLTRKVCDGIVLLCVLVFVGSMWAYFVQKFSVLDSVFFAITTASGTGLKTPHVQTSTHLLFVTSYCLLVVPLFQFIVSTFVINFYGDVFLSSTKSPTSTRKKIPKIPV